ncbi:hypothetical protein V4R08_07285 [Nitrobacter sp. NHB1]|uniref:hypothetical protein n=1 Tax=Nitrobacter sp. NHB1 TaxID=3119830 RepID=UPI002FFFC158
MRTLALPIVVASLIMGAPIIAQGSPGTSNPKNQTQQDITIRNIQVVDIEELQPDERSKVDAFLANTKQEDLQSLRDSIATAPEVVAALKAKGRVSAQVVAINFDESGLLTIFTKKAA